MPLKHSTESVYIGVLALLIVLTGIALAVIPALPQGLAYFGILFIVTLAYPLFLVPTFRNNRSDYEFRLLHWFPFAMVVIWGAFHMLSSVATFFAFLLTALLFIWSLPLVFLGLLLLALFCYSVIRRRTPRLVFLGALFGLFLIAGVLSHTMDWNDTVKTALLKRAPLIAGTGSGKTIASVDTSDSSSEGSVMSGKSSSKKMTAQSSSRAPNLPHSGPAETAAIVVTLLGLYTAVLQKRHS